MALFSDHSHTDMNPSSFAKKDPLASTERMPRFPSMSVLGSLRFLDYLGTVAFAISGSILAAMHSMDALGCVMIGFITAVGGGTVRDCIWGRVPGTSAFWLEEIEYMYLGLAGSLIGFLFCWSEQPGKQTMDFLVFWGDTFGLGAFAVIGTMHATRADCSALAAVLCAVINSTCGGIIRDALVGVPIRVMHNHEELYAETVALGSIAYLVGRKLDVDLSTRVLVGMWTVIIARVLSTRYQLRNVSAWS